LLFKETILDVWNVLLITTNCLFSLKIIFVIAFSLILVSSSIIGFNAFAQEIPPWIKNNAGWWAEGAIDDTAFLQGIQFLIKEGVMVIPPTETSGSSESQEVPGWIKNNAAWWAADEIDDGTFLTGIQFLIKNGIISIDQEKSAEAIVEPADKIYDVIIIGAGMSGIAAADKLDSEGMDVLILEARDRIGGRIWTIYWDEAEKPIDMGASWIHGATNNPMTKIANDNGFELLETDLTSRVILGSNGEWLTDAQVDEVDILYRNFQNYYWGLAETIGKDIPIKTAEENFIKMKNLSEEEKDWLRFIINADLEHEEAADSTDLSLKIDIGKPFGGAEVIFPGGYKQILDTMTDGLNIKLEHVVSKVQYDDAGVIVTTDKGEFNSKYVISTVSIGVLQSGDIEFSPALPANKLQAIDNIGMGLMNKLYLIFEDDFWDDVTLLNYVTEDQESMWEFLNLNALGEPILLGFTIGDHSRELEKVSDKEIVDNAMSVLRNMYGEETLEPLDYVRTTWGVDPYAYGAYSFSKVGMTISDYNAIAAPVDDRVFFAGEGTFMDHTATVHGAYLSGLREAANISNLN